MRQESNPDYNKKIETKPIILKDYNDGSTYEFDPAELKDIKFGGKRKSRRYRNKTHNTRRRVWIMR